MNKSKHTVRNRIKALALVVALATGALLSVATSSSKPRPSARTTRVLLKNPFPTGAWVRIYGPTRRVLYLSPRSSRVIRVPSGYYRLYWKRPSYMRRYRYYRRHYFRPGGFVRWKVGMI